jgi:hypothetical protein
MCAALQSLVHSIVRPYRLGGYRCLEKVRLLQNHNLESSAGYTSRGSW